MDQLLLCSNCQARIPSRPEPHPAGPRIDELLGCNEAPLDSEIDPFRSYLNGAGDRLRYVEGSITRLKESLESLENEREKLKGHIAKGRNVLHPIRRMPTELLQKIFGFSIEGGVDAVGERLVDSARIGSTLDIKGMHWVLGYVSHRWRSIMLSSPQLWTVLRLELEDSNFSLSWRTVLLELYIAQSHSLPLNVNLSAIRGGTYSYRNPETRGWNHMNSNHSFLSALFPSLSRWSSLCLVAIDPRLIMQCFSFLKPCQSLQSLSVIPLDTQHISSVRSCDIFEDASSLREVVLYRLPSTSLLSHLPFQQFTTLHVDIFGFTDVSPFLGCLRQMVKLEKLVIKCLYFTGASNLGLREMTPVLLSRVQHLELRLSENSNHSGETILDQFLGPLLLPKLVVLSVSNASPGSIQSLMTRSHCRTLEKLILSDTEIFEDGFILMTSNSYLLSIDFTGIKHLTDVAIAELTVREGHDPLLPKLEAIRLNGTLSFDAVKFVNMIESRWNANVRGEAIARPRIITLHLDCGSKPKNMDAFDRFDEVDFRGLQWKVSEYN